MVDGREQEHDAADGVERTQDGQVAEHIKQAGARQEQEPQRHERTEQLADRRGAGALHRKEAADNDDGNDDDVGLAVAKQGVTPLDGA